MATATGKKLYTAQQFMAMEFGDGLYELVQGELIKLSPSLYVHAVICGRITTILGVYGTTSGFGYVLSGEAAVWTTRNPDTVRGADVAFYSHARLPLKPENPPLPEIAPDVVVEILSPSNRPAEMLQKVSEYISAGVSWSGS